MSRFSPDQIFVNPDHTGLLSASLEAPSAHNVQPWRIKPLEDGQTYEIHCAKTDDLPHDPESKDAYLTMGAFVETMVLEAPNYGLQTEIIPELTSNGQDLYIARVAISPLVDSSSADSLSEWIDERVTNRNKYKKDPLPEELEENLRELGNVLIDPELLKSIVTEASKKAWADPRYVDDLKTWVRADDSAEDGITPGAFNLSRADMVALKFAFWRGRIKSNILGDFFASSESGMFTSAPAAAVLSVDEMTPEALFDGGRRLLRSWVTITGAGYSYQPFSVAVDERSTVPKVAEIADVSHPVALYRIGKATNPPKTDSNRKPLKKILIK